MNELRPRIDHDPVWDEIEEVGTNISIHWCPVGDGPLKFNASLNVWTCEECTFSQRVWKQDTGSETT